MKLNVITLAFAVTALGAVGANAQTTVIQSGPPAVVVDQPAVVVSPPVVTAPPAVVTAPPAVVTAPPAVVVEQPVQSTTVQRNDAGILGNSTTVTTDTVGAGIDCRKQTTTTNTLLGSNTSTNTTCN